MNPSAYLAGGDVDEVGDVGELASPLRDAVGGRLHSHLLHLLPAHLQPLADAGHVFVEELGVRLHHLRRQHNVPGLHGRALACVHDDVRQTDTHTSKMINEFVNLLGMHAGPIASVKFNVQKRHVQLQASRERASLVLDKGVLLSLSSLACNTGLTTPVSRKKPSARPSWWTMVPGNALPSASTHAIPGVGCLLPAAAAGLVTRPFPLAGAPFPAAALASTWEPWKGACTLLAMPLASTAVELCRDTVCS